MAIALPLQFDEVVAALHGGAYCDYVGRGRFVGSAQELWDECLAAVADTAKDLAGLAKSLGVQVVLSARLRDLKSLFSTCVVVTVVAHWRGPELTADDLLIAPEEIAQRIVSEESEFARLLRAGFPKDITGELETLSEERQRKSRLAEALDRRLRLRPPLLPRLAVGYWHLDPVTLYHSNRKAIERWAQDAFAQASRLEFADGLFSPDEIARVVPSDWAGIADFSSCQSAQLADAIKDDRVDRVLITNERETNPIRRMIVLSAVYETLDTGQYNYLSARRQVLRNLLKG